MERCGIFLLSVILSGAASLSTAALAAPPAPPQSEQDEEVYQELATPYKQWLEEDVLWIITDEERRAFEQLQTNEEREQFIEQFWYRRNPNPDSVENPVKEEHYRRIAYANERFSSGVAGWRTDRGRIYIMYGPPDSIESKTAGSIYNRPPWEGGGQTKVHGYEIWTYNYIEGIGQDVQLEFVDPTGTNEFHFTTNPAEKDAFLYVPNAGLTAAEEAGLASKADRIIYNDGMGRPVGGGNRWAMFNQKPFQRLELASKIFTPPPVKFKDLEAIVSSRIVRNQMDFDYRFDFLRITSDSVLVPITVQVPNREMTFTNEGGVHTATVNLFARISTLTGRVVQVFEETIRQDIPESLLERSLANQSIYQKAVPLRPGLYRLDIVIKDTTSNDVGVVNTRLAVAPFDDDKLEASSLILADEISPVARRDIGVGMFVIGSTKVRPKLDQTFSQDESLGVYMQLYNFKIDEATQKNQASVEVQVLKGDERIARIVQTSGELEQTGQQITYHGALPLQSLAPGEYRLEITATDILGNQTISRTAEFTVTPAGNANATAQSSVR